MQRKFIQNRGANGQHGEAYGSHGVEYRATCGPDVEAGREAD